TGVFTDNAPTDWDEPGLILSKEKGAAYVIIDEGDDPEVRPVINITSAQLILGSDNLTPRIVSQDVIDEQPLGDDIGILNAPAVLPDTSGLIGSGWTACTGTGFGLKADVSSTPLVQTSGDLANPVGFTVVTQDAEGKKEYWVIAEAPATLDRPVQAFRYLLTQEAGLADGLLDAVNLPTIGEASEVPPEWVALFPRGGDLDLTSFDLPDVGASAPGLDGAKVGQYLPDGAGGGYALSADGPVPLDPFAYAVYTHARFPDGRKPRPADLADVPDVQRAVGVYDAAAWPTQALSAVAGQQCALLEATAGETPRARLALDPTGDASAEGLDAATEREASVERGHAAYVMSGDWSDVAGDSVWAVDAKGRANALVGPDTAAQLGWESVRPTLVPDSWIKLFGEGVALSREAALCPPSRVTDPECS
ncbi:MAG: hypothetical protein F2667_05025, partial [Actinobacteria bacterium]|nr:hypothetical protein [Actinomycetota bacterium]